MKRMNDVADNIANEVAQQEHGNSKYYVSTFRYILVLFPYNVWLN